MNARPTVRANPSLLNADESRALSRARPDGMVWIVVPAYNEAGIIRDVLTGLFRLYSNVIVDACSIDATGALASAAGAHVV